MCPGPSVEDVAEDVKLVDGQPLDDVADGYDEVVGTAGVDNGVDDALYVGCLVDVLATLVEQFLDDVGEVGRQGLAHLRVGVFAGDVAANAHEPVDHDVVPFAEVALLDLDELELLLGIVDERAELALHGIADFVAEDFVDLALDVARGILHDVLEGAELSVQVGQEMLGALGEVQYGLQVDNLGAGLGHRGERLGEQVEVSEVVFDVVVMMGAHS